MEGLYFASGVDNNFVKDVNKMLSKMDELKNKTVKNTATMEDSFSKLQKRAMQVFSGVALTSFIKQVIEVRNEVENLTNAFAVMLQSKEKANKLMSEIVTTAATTPFSVLEIANASKQLLAFGQSSDTVVSTLRRLGDVASASGSQISDVTSIYGKVQGKNRLELEQLNQFTERGIPVLQELAKMYDTNTAGILKMVEKGKISFADLQQSIFNLTSEGGKFYNMMQTQSATVSGMMSNLGDQYDQMLNAIGQSQTATITGTIKLLSTLLDHWEEIANAIGIAVVAYGSYKAVVMSMAVFNEAKIIMQAVSSLGLLASSLTTATVAQEGLNVAMSMNPVGLIVAGLTALVAGLYLFGDWSSDTEQKLKNLAETSEESNKKIAKSFDELRKKLNKSNLSDSELLEIKKEMIKIYPKELEYIKVQKLNSSQLLDIWEKIKKTHQDLGDIDLNNNAIKELELRAKHLEDIAKGITADDVSGMFDVAWENIGGINVNKRVIDEYKDIKTALTELYAKNEELKKGADKNAEDKLKALADAEAERIRQLEINNDLEYQKAVNHANKMYGADVSNAHKLKDTLYKIELEYLDKQMKAIDEQAKGKLSKEQEYQKAQLEAKKIGLINQRKLEEDERIYRDKINQSVTKRDISTKNLNTFFNTGGQLIQNEDDENLSDNINYKTPPIGVLVNTPQNDEYVKIMNEKILSMEQLKIDFEFYREQLTIETKKLMNLEKNKAEKSLLDTQKEKILDLEQNQKNIIQKFNDYLDGKYLLNDIINSNKTVSEKINDELKILGLMDSEYSNLFFSTEDELSRLRNTLEHKSNMTESEKKLIINNIKKQEQLLLDIMFLQEENNLKIKNTTKKNITDAKKNNIYIDNFNDEMDDIDTKLNDISLKKFNTSYNKLNKYKKLELLELKNEDYLNKLEEIKTEISFFEKAYKEAGIDPLKTPVDIQDNSGNFLSSTKYIALIEIFKKLKEGIKETKEEIESTKFDKIKEISFGAKEIADQIISLVGDGDYKLNNLIQKFNILVNVIHEVVDSIEDIRTASKNNNFLGQIFGGIAILKTVGNILIKIDENEKKKQNEKDIALSNELKANYAVIEALIQKNALYAEGNEFFSNDSFGTALRNLESYNMALKNQTVIINEIVENAGVTDYQKGIIKIDALSSKDQVRGRAKEEAMQYENEYKKAFASIEVKTKSRSKLGSAIGLKDTYSNVLDLYPQILDAEGKINDVVLERVVADGRISEADKTRLQNLLDNSKALKEYYKQYGEFIAGIFGGVGDSITDAFQTAYESTQNFADAGIMAMKDLEESFSNMIESFTKDAIESAILQPLINQLNEVNKALGEEYASSSKSGADSEKLQQGIINSLGNFYNQVSASQGLILDTYKQADEMAKQAGFDSVFNSGTTSSTDTSGTGNVVGASITQEVSNEIVARINGIFLNSEHILKSQNDAVDYAIKANLYLSNISANSNYLISIDDRLKKMNEKL